MARKVIVQNVGESLMVTVPKSVAELLDISKGDSVYWTLNGSNLILSKEGK